MPLTRHRIRNEYSLADSELYRAADKDDPEALLEGVAMAGLVGVLRQLGDLAEFAAEIFHDLHEEVMATATRGHGLVVRVQQLEAEFSSIEKAFLSQTSHSLTFYNTGVIWHPNLRMDQNLIVQGDLPRFVMDSYEECRGPPRLFLLDKFDVAGAGSCLKRYTDPSFFKVDSSSFGMMNSEVQRERKTRKAKKKGSRWRNGETPEVIPTSHAKLQQLFLEESVENYINDPARRVKLKRRLSGFPFDTKSGKSYMEKFLETSPTEHSSVHEISGNSSPLKLPSNITGEPGIEILEIRTVSPEKEPLQRKSSPHSSPRVEDTRRKQSMVELREEVNYGISELTKPNPSSEAGTALSLHKELDEKEIMVDGERKIEGSANGYQFDDIASEVENYVDALTTMDAEMETDAECRAKDNLGFLNIENQVSDANEEQQGHQAHFSDDQSMGNYTATDDGNSSRKRISSFSYYDSPSNLAENMPSDGDLSARVFLSTEICEAEVANMSSDWCSANGESLLIQPLERKVSDGDCIEEAKTPRYRTELGEPSSNSCLTDSATTLSPVDAEESLIADAPPEISSNHNELNTKHMYREEIRTSMGDNLSRTSNLSDVTSLTRHDILPDLSADNNPVDGLDGEDPHVLSHSSLHLSNILELASATKSSETLLGDLLQAECTEEECTKFLVDSQIDSPKSVASHREEQTLDSALPKLETCVPDVKPDAKVSEVDEMMSSEDLLGDMLQEECTEECTKFLVDSQIDSPKPVASHREEQTLGSALPELETCVPDVKPDSKVSEVDEMMSSENLVGDMLHAECTEEECTKFSVDSQIDSPKSVASHIEEKTLGSALPELETCVPVVKTDAKVEVDETKSSEDLLGDILQAECTEEECSKFSVDSQIDSSKSVASHREEQTLGSALPDLETCVPDVKSYGKVSEVDDAPQLSGEIASSSTPVVGNPQASNFTKQQFLEITENVFPLEPDSEIGASYSSEGDLYGALNAADGEELRGFSSDIGMVGKNAANVEFPTDFQIITDLPPSPDVHLDVDDVETETIHSEAMIVANAVADTHDDDNRDSGRSLTTCPTKLQDESISISQDLRQNGLAIYEVCSPEHLQESGIEKKVDQQTVASSDLNSVMRNTVPCDDSKSELLNNVTAASMAALSGNSLHVVESHSDPLSSHQNDQDSKSKSHQQINVIANIEDAAPSPSNHIAEMRTPLVQKVELQADQFSVEYWHAGKESSEPPFQVEWIQSHNHLNQEGHPDASSEFCAAHLPCQTSKSEFLSQLDVSEQATEPSNSIFPSFGLLPEVAEINLDEMPPLPPLPPVQWRMGKVQHSSLAPERDLLGHNLYPSLQTFPLTADEKAELDHLATEGDITQPLNPLLPLSAAKVGNSQQGYENLAGYEEHATQLSLQVPTMVNCGNNEDDFPTSGRTQSTNTFLALPTIFNGRSQHGFLATEGGTAHATLNSFSPAMNVEDPISIYPPGSLQEKLIQSQHQLPPQMSSEDKKLQGTFVVSKGEAANPPEISFPQPDMQDDQPKHFFYYPEGETVLSSPFVPLAPSEDGKPNGIRQMKLPRPRNPLIDAVVAHDKSKLKKVTDLVRPKIGQELDERNSLLEEIRTKSFNLKPAVKTRPSNKGPKTNLKVAAILEKANAIRQALAGSDEDDDVDGWSDS